MTDRYNAFISYAWCDNETLDPGGKGWISTFVDRLWKLLRRELPREMAKVPIWLDYEQLRGSDNVTDRIRRELEASRLLVPVISRGYLESPWCTQEREIFIKRHGPDSGRIFPVWMEPIDDLPPELASLLKYQFWYEDDHKQPRTRWFPDIDPTDREYGFIQQNMARHMAARIEKAMLEEASAPLPEPAPAASPPTKPDGDHLVLVNGGEADAELVLEVADRLGNAHGVNSIVPVSALRDEGKLKSSEITRDIRDKLKLCTAVLIVYRNGPAHQVNRHITEYLKITPQRSKNRPPATLDLCHPSDAPAAIGVSSARCAAIHADLSCADDCAQLFTQGLASP